MPAQNNPKIKPKRETIETDRAAFFIRRFLPVYAAYLTPLWICLYTDEGQEAKSLQLGQVHDSFLWLCVWWIVVSICYGSLRHILPHPRVNAKFHKKEAHLHKQDLVGLLALNTGTAFLGRVLNRLENPTTCLPFLGCLIFFLAFYTLLFEIIKEYDLTLTPAGVRCPYTITVSVIMLCSTGLLIRNHAIQCANQDSTFLLNYVQYSILIVGVHFALIFGPGSGVVHIHHSWWAWILTFLCIFDNGSSMVAQAMFLGVHIHGVAAFGVEPIFERKHEIELHHMGQRHVHGKAL